MRPLRPRHRSVLPLVFVGLVLVGGVSAFWFGLRAFRAHAEEQAAEKAFEVSDETSEAFDATTIPSIAVLGVSGQDVGRATRVFTEGSATVDILATLPSLDVTTAEYRVWLVKDGLADVVDIGALTPRADGTWAGVFLAGPATGVLDPAFYSEVVVMLEYRDGNPAPSGIKACAGSW